MKIGVITDTHISESGARAMPPRLWDDFRGVDLILHAGDLVASRVITELETIAPVFAVAGNNDSPSLGLPQFRRLELGGLIVGMAHGDRYAAGDTGGRSGRKRVPFPLPFSGNGQTSAFARSHIPDADVLIFGHSHKPLLARTIVGGDLFDPEREVLLINPGSPTEKRWSEYWGVAILTIEGGEAHAQAVLW